MQNKDNAKQSVSHKSRKIINIALVCCFIAAIWLPLIFSDKAGGGISVAENRMLAPFPKILGSVRGLNFNAILELEPWIEDNAGGRETMSKINTIIDYDLFGISNKSDTLLGKDKWTFFYNTPILEDYQHKNIPSNDAISYYSQNFSTINQYLTRQSINFIGMLLPDKKSVYSEMYPQSVIPGEGQSRFELLNDCFNGQGMEFLYPLDALRNKTDNVLYYSPRIDNAHWNAYGAFIGYRELMAHVKVHFPDVFITNTDNYSINEFTSTGVFNNAVPISEIDYEFIPNAELNEIIKDENFFRDLDMLTFADNYNAYCHRYINPDSTLPKAVFWGDSYALKQFQFLSQSFSELTFLHLADTEFLPEVIEIAKPDIVIYECVERMYDYSSGKIEALVQKINSLDSNGVVELPEKQAAENHPWLYLDFYNNTLVPEDKNISIPQNQGTVILEGWAIDPDNSSPASSVIIKVGSELYTADYGKSRETVAEAFNNVSYTNCGFTIELNAQEILINGGFSIYVVSGDEQYKYPPQQYTATAA